MSSCLKIPKTYPLAWLNVMPSLTKLCQVVMNRNEEANLQPPLKGRGCKSQNSCHWLKMQQTYLDEKNIRSKLTERYLISE